MNQPFFFYLVVMLYLVLGNGCHFDHDDNSFLSKNSESQKLKDSTFKFDFSLSTVKKKIDVKTPPFSHSDTMLNSDNKFFELKIAPVYSTSLKRIPITIVNHTCDKLYTGSDYQLEYYNPLLSKWENNLPSDFAYTLDLYVIEPHNKCNMTIYIYNSKPGKYRVIKNVSVYYDFDRRSYNYQLMKDFLISDSIR